MHSERRKLVFAFMIALSLKSFALRFYVPVNNYGHVEMVSSSNHTFFLGKLD